jgi:uncharacterized lipoprotein YajG
MHPWKLIAPLACLLLIASCAARPNFAPQIATPAEAARPCSLYILPADPTQADLEVGYVTRGAALVACDAARRLAVQTHEAEHELEAKAVTQGR